MPTDEIVRRAGLSACSSAGPRACPAARPSASASPWRSRATRTPVSSTSRPSRWTSRPRGRSGRHAGFAAEGRTILFATHYLEEADQVADRIVVLDHGRIVADGSAGDIKAGGRTRRIRFQLIAADPATLRGLPGVRHADVAGDA
jgi:hypothetical protein